MQRIALLLASLLLLTAAACGGDSDDPETVTPEPTAEETPPPASANETFDELAAGFTTAEFAVTYTTEATLDELPFTGEPFETEWDWKQSGDLVRFDFDGTIVGFEGTMIIITTPEESFICVGMGCLGSPPDLPIYGSPSGPLSEAVLALSTNASAGEISLAEPREIAGVEAQCFDIAGGAEDTSGIVCLSESGVTLFADVEIESGPFLLEAIEYSDSVDASEFEAPHDVTGI